MDWIKKEKWMLLLLVILLAFGIYTTISHNHSCGWGWWTNYEYWKWLFTGEC